MHERPTALAAMRTWASVAATTIARLGPAMAIAPFGLESAWRFQRQWATDVLLRLGIDVHVELRLEPQSRRKGALFVHLNQQTLLAPLLYAVSLEPCALVVNVEYAALPFVGWTSIAMGGVPIVRQRPSQAKRALARVRERIVRGEDFGISIEGRRTRDGSLGTFKKGAVVLALEAQCDIIPFMTHGEYALWPRGEWRIAPGRVDVVVYPPIATRGLRYEDRDWLLADLRTLAERETTQYRERADTRAR
jgi:1-acyl-sn-glycerol-3-phosphate acyltransferase